MLEKPGVRWPFECLTVSLPSGLPDSVQRLPGLLHQAGLQLLSRGTFLDLRPFLLTCLLLGIQPLVLSPSSESTRTVWSSCSWQPFRDRAGNQSHPVSPLLKVKLSTFLSSYTGLNQCHLGMFTNFSRPHQPH